MSMRQSLALNFSSTPNKSCQNTFFHYLPEGGSITAAKYRSFSKITSRLEKRSLSSLKSIWACPPKIVLLNCILYYWNIQRSNDNRVKSKILLESIVGKSFNANICTFCEQEDCLFIDFP